MQQQALKSMGLMKRANSKYQPMKINSLIFLLQESVIKACKSILKIQDPSKSHQMNDSFIKYLYL